MPELIDAFDSYKDFDREAYFTVCFDKIASQFFLEIPLIENKEKQSVRTCFITDWVLNLAEMIFHNAC